MKFLTTEKLLIQEISEATKNLLRYTRGLSIGELIKIVRTQLGMSQSALASRAGVPQATISRVEKGQRNVGLSTLQKILSAMSCDLVIVPMLHDTIESIQQKQARMIAKKRVHYLKGTMNLEKQQPDKRFTDELINQEEKRLLQESKSKLWEE
jgi:predicted DNA-binding mobile mystery protein A